MLVACGELQQNSTVQPSTLTIDWASLGQGEFDLLITFASASQRRPDPHLVLNLDTVGQSEVVMPGDDDEQDCRADELYVGGCHSGASSGGNNIDAGTVLAQQPSGGGGGSGRAGSAKDAADQDIDAMEIAVGRFIALQETGLDPGATEDATQHPLLPGMRQRHPPTTGRRQKLKKTKSQQCRERASRLRGET
jgi:hypothetical protein